MIGHGHPSLNMFYMIKHHMSILQHSLDQIEFKISAIDKCLEQKKFTQPFDQENNCLENSHNQIMLSILEYNQWSLSSQDNVLMK